jgi:hypothetical protein
VDVWTCGRVDVWTCGRVDVWSCGRVDVWTWYPNDIDSGQLFFAFFMKKQVLHADPLSQAMAKRCGVQLIVYL